MKKISKIMVISSLTNIFLALIKVIFGIIGKCSSLITDGIHSFSDLSTDVVAIIGNNLSNKESDEEHPFGHGKIEYITSTIIGFVIIIVGLLLIRSSFKKEIIVPNVLIVFVSLATVILKYILAIYINNNGIKYKNNILIASAKESRADAYSSIFVLISIILMQFSDQISLFKYADIVGSIIISLFIIKSGYDILRDNISNLLEKKVDDIEFISKIEKTILEFDSVLEIKNLLVFKYGPYYRLISEIIMDKNITLYDAHEAVDQIEFKLKKNIQK